MNNPGIFSRWLSVQKHPTLKLEELAAILDFIPKPVLFVDLTSFQILLANALATELTAYTRSELTGRNLDAVLSCQDPDASLLEMIKFANTYLPDDSFYITNRSGGRVNVHITGTTLINSNQMLILLEADRERARKQSEAQKSRLVWQQLEQIAQALQSTDLSNALTRILSIACQISEADVAAVYQADGETLELVRIAAYGEENLLPARTSPQDLINVPENPIWLRRNHPVTPLQSLARRAGLAYLAGALLGQLYARVGMVVLAGRSAPPAFLAEAMPGIAAFTTAALDTITRITNLQSQIRDKTIQLSIAQRLKDLIQDNLILLDSDLNVVDINQAAESSLGYSNREALHQPIERILISSEPLEPLFELAMRGQETPPLEDIQLFRRAGEAFSAHLRVVPCEFSHESIGLAILFQDLSERERFRRENEILEQRAVLGEVTASFAHEVRNPINNISTGLQLLQVNLPEDDPHQENIRRLQQDCNRLNDLIKSGLSFIRPMEYKMELVHIGDLLENLIQSWKHRLERANIQYQLQVEAGVLHVEGDLRALEQVFTNLINNAFEAMTGNPGDRPKRLGIKVRRQPTSNGTDQLLVSISDTGMGIPDEIRERIFEPFFTTKPGGSGIGLAIVKRIVTAHKGAISVESIPGGTVFQVLLPVYRERTQPILETTA